MRAPGIDAQLHARLWGLGVNSHAMVLVDMAGQGDFEGLNGFLDAIEEGLLPDFEERMRGNCHLALDNKQKARLPDRRLLAGATVELPLMEILAISVSSPQGSDFDHPWRHLATLKSRESDYLRRCLKVFRHSSPREEDRTFRLDEARSTCSLYDRLVGTVVARCRDPAAVRMVLDDRGSLAGGFAVRSGPISPSTNELVPLTRLASVHLNPAAMSEVLARDDCDMPMVAGNVPNSPPRKTPDSPLELMADGFFKSLPESICKASAPQAISAIRTEFDGGFEHEPAGMTQVMKRLIERLDIARSAALHALLMREACQPAPSEAIIGGSNQVQPVIDAVLAMAPEGETLESWYHKAAAVAGEIGRNVISDSIEQSISSLISSAAAIGAHEVLGQFAQTLRDDLSRLPAQPDRYEKPLVRGLLDAACIGMCEDDRQVAIERFKQTVDTLLNAGYRVTPNLGLGLSADSGGRFSTTLHEMAKRGGEVQLAALLHMVSLGADPAIKDRQNRTPQSWLKSKGLDKVWQTALRSQSARSHALAALGEIDQSLDTALRP